MIIISMFGLGVDLRTPQLELIPVKVKGHATMFDLEVVLKLALVFIIILLTLLTLFTVRPWDGLVRQRRRPNKKKKSKVKHSLKKPEILQSSRVQSEIKRPYAIPTTSIPPTVHTPCMGCKLLNAKKGCSYNCCASCCRGNINSICRVHGTGYHACALAVKAAVSLRYSVFDISYAHLKRCPPGIPGIGSQLLTLNISNNRLVDLPSDIGQLANLTELFAQYNCLSSLPDSVCKLRRLIELDVKNNSLTFLPEDLGSLDRLLSLNLTNNRLVALPTSVGLLTRLEEFSVHSNLLTCLPDEICNLARLKTLYAGENKLLSLPHLFGNLVRLEELDLSNCQLTILPESLASCTSLTRLWLSDNKLVALPCAIGSLHHLKEFHVRNNRIRCFPSSIKELDLYSFSAKNNNCLTEREASFFSSTPKTSVPPLLELACKIIIARRVPWTKESIPAYLGEKLSHPSHCATCSRPVFNHAFSVVRFRTISVFYRLPMRYTYCSVRCKDS